MNLAVWIAALPLNAHMVSISTGELKLDGRRAVYDLRLPLYEVQHMKDPERELFDRIRFRGAVPGARRCAVDGGENAFRCRAEYEFDAVPDFVFVECTFHKATVPNHVHVLRASREGKSDQAVFDAAFSTAELRFRPPTALESAARQFTDGALRSAGGAAQILFLLALALAARSRSEAVWLAAAFVAGQAVSAFVLPATGFRPAARFVEASLALTVAYLALEMLALPRAGRRWLVAGVLGLFHGLYLGTFLAGSEYPPAWVLAGAGLAEGLLFALLYAATSRLARLASALHPVRIAASLLLVTGLVWFVVRLRG